MEIHLTAGRRDAGMTLYKMIDLFSFRIISLSLAPMYTHDHKIRVRYADTDQMGYVYYGNYARYYEEARAEAIRSLGMPYKEMELGGIMLPITRMNIKYI